MSTNSSYYGNGHWWSRSPYAYYSYIARFVYDGGTLNYVDYGSVNQASYGVRPSFTVSIG
jgi:hypothetical protein